MRTWSVSGTAFALCTRSSSLSMRTSTSMNPRSLQRKHYSLVLPKRRLKKPRFWGGSGVGSGSAAGSGSGKGSGSALASGSASSSGSGSGWGSGSGSGADSDSGGLRDGSSRASFVPKTQRRPLSRSRARIASNLQLLDELQRILSRQRDAAAVAAFEEAFESLRLVHSPGFSGVPGRPSGNISANRLATAAGTSPSTFPPNEAISFTPLEETKLTSALA